MVRDYEGNLWIETRRQKTGTPENVRLLDIAVKSWKIQGDGTGGETVPHADQGKHEHPPEKMAVQCGIDRNLSFHMARHSFASQICLSQGVPIETVSKAMGHRNISTTQRYAKVTNEKVDRDVTALSHEITGKYTLSGIDLPPSTILKDMGLREQRRKEKNTGLNRGKEVKA